MSWATAGVLLMQRKLLSHWKAGMRLGHCLHPAVPTSEGSSAQETPPQDVRLPDTQHSLTTEDGSPGIVGKTLVFTETAQC